MGDQQTDSQQQTQGGEGESDDQEKSFWEKFDARIDAAVERNLKRHAVTGSSRTGRTTLPAIFADIMFGKPASKS